MNKQCSHCKLFYPANRVYFPPHKGLPFDDRPCKQCRAKLYGKQSVQKRIETTRQAALDRAIGNVDTSYFDEWQLPVLEAFRRNTFTKRRDIYIKGQWKSKRSLVQEYLAKHKRDMFISGDILRLKISRWIEAQIDWLNLERLGLSQEVVHFVISISTINKVRREMSNRAKS